MRLIAAVLATTILWAASVSGQSSSSLTVDDLQKLRAITSTVIAPDGSKVLYTIEESDFQQNTRAVSIWIVDVRDKKTIRIVGDGIATSAPPQWSSDGQHFAYLSRRDGNPQICVSDGRPGNSITVTHSSSGVDSFRWSPDGKTIAYLTTLPAAPTSSIEGVRVVTNEKPPRVELHTLDTVSKQDRSIPLGEVFPEAVSWSPDGKQLVFSSNSDLYTLRLSDGARTTLVERPGIDRNPIWSPDGNQIAFISNYGKPVGTKISISVVAADGKSQPVDKYETLDFGFGGYPPRFLRWSSDSRSLFVSVLSRMTQNLFSISVSDGATKRITQGDGRVFHDFSFPTDTAKFAFVMTDPTTPGEVFVSSVQDFNPSQLTTGTNQHLAAKNVLQPEVIQWKSSDGTEIEGLLLKPRDYFAGKRYPLLVQMEGTYGSYDLSFTGRVSADTASSVFPFQQQIFAALGYVVLMPNPRGSWGYGENFRLLGRKEYGPGPANDCISGVDHLIASGIADPDRLGIMGTGFDGYRAAFAISQSDRFKAASIGQVFGFDLTSWYGQADIYQRFLELSLGGPPWKVPENYARISPSAFASNIKTPTFVFHIEIPSMPWALGQSQELYTALRKNNVPVEFAIYSFHQNNLRPKVMGDMIQRNLDWFQKWIKPS